MGCSLQFLKMSRQSSPPSPDPNSRGLLGVGPALPHVSVLCVCVLFRCTKQTKNPFSGGQEKASSHDPFLSLFTVSDRHLNYSCAVQIKPGLFLKLLMEAYVSPIFTLSSLSMFGGQRRGDRTTLGASVSNSTSPPPPESHGLPCCLL